MKELTQLKKKVLELEDVHKNDKEVIKKQLKVIKDLEQQVDSLQNTVSNNGNASKNDKTEQSERINCFNFKECNSSFENKSRLKKHVNEKHQKKI